MLPDAAVRHYEEQSNLSDDVARLIAGLWAAMSVADINRSWAEIRERVFVGISVAQLQAALSAETYLAAVLAETGQVAPPVGRVNARAFAGVASDGRPLGTLIEEPRIATLTRIAQGATPRDALDTGLVRLARIAVTQTQDAGREAVGVGITARPGVFGYIRMVSPPCCKRCAILAGKWFGWNKGFKRHPGCDCRHIPIAENAPGDIGTDPGVLFDSGQVRGVSKVDQEAIDDGADPVAVVNATGAGQVSDDGMTTTESTTKRGRATKGRLTPAGIYAKAKGDRAQALALLKSNGYIAGDMPKVARKSRSSVPPQLRDRFTADTT